MGDRARWTGQAQARWARSSSRSLPVPMPFCKTRSPGHPLRRQALGMLILGRLGRWDPAQEELPRPRALPVWGLTRWGPCPPSKP